MQKISDLICKHKTLIIMLTLILLIPALIGIATTKINYDILVYLPSDIKTIDGQNILTEDFNMGAFSVSIIENMPAKDILKLEEQIKKVAGVEKVLTIYDLAGSTIPLEMLPDDLISKVKNDDADLMIITFTNSTSDETTLNAIESIKDLTKEHCKIGGMSAMVLDTMNLSESEITIYIIIAVILCLIILEFSLDSYIVPFILLLNIGIAILFNLGTNLFLGEISYITKALVAVLQLGVTTDFSIFLYHSYEHKKDKYKTKEEAMSKAICETFTSVFGSSLTTIAGFLVLCTMSLTLGRDLGLVMAKGVFLGVLCVLTIFPSMLLICDKLIEKTKHKIILPKFTHLNNFIVKHHKKIFLIFLILLIPAYLANRKVEVYYKLDESLPKNLDSIIANNELKTKFNIVSPEIIILDKNLKPNTINEMISEIENIEGIDFILSFSKLSSIGLNEEMLSEEVLSIFQNDKYQMLLLNSTYDIATNELNNQVTEIEKIITKYDENAILAGEGPLMKDLVTISDNDFKNVNYSSIICIMLIMLIVLKSLSLPILLICIIEFAIFINMSIPYFSSITLPFVAPIVLGTIELGATIDYAILMTTTYLENRKKGNTKQQSITLTLNSCVHSILVSGLCFFSATFGVGIISKIEMISSLCTLISRGAIISMLVVILVLPSVLLIFDKLICKTTKLEKKEKKIMTKKINKAGSLLMLTTIMYSICLVPVNALTKEETVYTKLNYDGSPSTTIAQEHLINNENLNELSDLTNLTDILNINGNETFTQNEKNILWNSAGQDIFYQGTTSKEVPISLNIKYYLNDTEHNLEDMIGKSGKVTIKLQYTNNDIHTVNVNGNKTSMSTPFVILTGTMLDLSHNKNVTITNGKVINNGTKSILVGMTAPGLKESLNTSSIKTMDTITINFDTTKFELPSIYSLVTPKVLESSDLKIFDKLNPLYSNMTTLKKSIDEIEKGAKTLSTGLTTIDSAALQISDNLKIIKEKMGELETGAIAVDEGLKAMLAELKKTENSLTSGPGGASTIKTMISANKEAITNLANANKKLESIYGKDNLTGSNIPTPPATGTLPETNDTENQTPETPTTPTPDALSSVKATYQSNQKLIYLLGKNNEVLNGILSTIGNISSDVSSVTTTIEKYLTEIEAGANSVATGTTALKQGVELLSSKMSELSVGTSKLNTGATTLLNGITKFNKEGITKLNSTVNNELKSSENKIKALVKLGEEYDTFTLKSDEVSGTTKFIMVVNSKKAPTENIVLDKPKSKDNLWTKVKNLFK